MLPAQDGLGPEFRNDQGLQSLESDLASTPVADSSNQRPSHEVTSHAVKNHDLRDRNKQEKLKSWCSECELLLALMFFGIAGATGRNGLEQLLGFEGLGSVWPNFTGCFVIALTPAITTPVLNTVIGVGFCGAMTSFSELITDIMMQSTTPRANWPDYGYGVPLFMARLLLEISCCFVGFTAGTHAAELWRYLKIPRLSENTEVWVRRCCALLGLAAWIVCLVTAITSPNRSRWWPLSGLFAPFGVWLRFYLSKLNDSSPLAFKWGTFAANIFATLVACILQLCELLTGTSPLQLQFLLGLQKGFCGCLSTISTLIRELNSMKTARSYFYGFVSIFVGYCLAFIIIGSYRWTR